MHGTGGQLLARPGFSEHDHAVLRGPGAGDEFKHLAHGRRISDDVVEAAGLEALAELFVFPADAELVLLFFRNVVDEPFNGNERARGVERARGLLPHPFFLAPRRDDAVDEFPASVLLEGRCDGAADGFAVLFVGDVQEAEAFLAHEPVRCVPRQAKDAVADEADRAAGVGDASDDGFPVGEAGQVVEQGQQLAAVLVQLLADFGVVAFELLAHLLVHDVRTHACQHLGVMERLGDVVDAADLEPPRFLAGIVHVGNEDHGDVAQPGIPFDMLADGIAVHIRHHDVEQYQIRDLFAHVFQCFCPAFGDAEPVFPVQLADEYPQVGGIIVHDEDKGLFVFRFHKQRLHHSVSGGSSASASS